MKNNKIALLPGLSLFVCFCLLTGSGVLAHRFGGGAPVLALAEAVSFLIPFGILVYAKREKKTLWKLLRPRRLGRGAIGLSIKMGAAVAVLSLFLNFAIYQVAGLAGADLSAIALDAPQSGLSYVGKFLVVVLLSAIVEEFYLRGALFSVHSEQVGTSACLLVSGAAFAMLHGNWMNFAGPFAAGVAYAYLTYVFGSIWPAVIAHIVNNLYYVFVLWITETYAAFGIWRYFAACNGLALLLFAYLTLRSLEALLARGAIPHFEKSAGLYDVWLLIRNPGIAAFVIAFVAKTVFHWI